MARMRGRGFTLIEIMITLTIMAIMGALAAPAMSGMIASQRLRGMATDFHQALLKARSEAIKRNTSVTVSPIGGSWASGWTIVDPANPSGPPLDQRAAAGNITVTADLSTVVYRGNGRISVSTTPTFVFSASAATDARCVSIDPMGRPYGKKGSTC